MQQIKSVNSNVGAALGVRFAARTLPNSENLELVQAGQTHQSMSLRFVEINAEPQTAKKKMWTNHKLMASSCSRVEFLLICSLQ